MIILGFTESFSMFLSRSDVNLGSFSQQSNIRGKHIMEECSVMLIL